MTETDLARGGDWAIAHLPGIGDDLRARLDRFGIHTTAQLLQYAAPARRDRLAAALQVRRVEVDKWLAMADLARVPGVGCQSCGLLLHAGIASVAQLAQTPVRQLHWQILRFQVATLQRRDLCPSPAELQTWVERARQLARRSR